ncbi:MAG: SOS response-associated peptidase [Eubacteriales bacterium]|nr:SOS response-associated peptidase [Eubacteriales bacterium]MDD3197571.1 SOS response-associated peptidase [Eubacteriales bacterium]MDD3503076.1 SOS response-associated peptidase [Eubacteriales bacterium]MDD4682745.1 SOS response-associated peptidase [Eubacteriales bacterium]
MCGRYYIGSEDDSLEIRQILTELNKRYQERNLPLNLARGEIFPTQEVPVLLAESDEAIYSLASVNGVKPVAMSWGFPAPGGKRQSIINARCETASVKPMFRTSVEKSRLLVPASAYFEWQKMPDGSKQKMRITSNEDELLLMAGLWRLFTNSKGERLLAFVILTRPATSEMTQIHERMPLILNSDLSELWLHDLEAAQKMLAEPPGVELSAQAVR